MTELSRRTAWLVAIAATLTMTVSYIDRATFGVLAPSVTKELGISEAAYGWLASSFNIAYLVATPLAGWWIDRIGARRGLVGSVIVWSIVAAAHALVPGFGVLLALRIALGLAEGPSFPGAAQTVQRALPPGDRSRGFGVLFTGSSIGGMLVPPLAAWLFGIGGWRVAFLGTAIVGLVWVPMWLLVTGRPAVRARLDAAHEVYAEPRPRFAELVRHPLMVRALIAIFAVAPAIGLFHQWGSKFLVRAFDIAQKDVGHYLWFPPLVFDVGAVLFGDLGSRLRRAEGAPPRLLVLIAAVMCSALALLPLATGPWDAMAIFAISMAGGGGVYTLVTADLLGRIPPRSISLAGGTLAGAQSLALIIVNPLVGVAVDAYASYDQVALTLGAWALPGVLLWAAWPPPPYTPTRTRDT